MCGKYSQLSIEKWTKGDAVAIYNIIYVFRRG